MASCWERVGFYRAMVLIFCDRLTPLLGSRSYYHLLREMQKREEPDDTAGVEESAVLLLLLVCGSGKFKA